MQNAPCISHVVLWINCLHFFACPYWIWISSQFIGRRWDWKVEDKVFKNRASNLKTCMKWMVRFVWLVWGYQVLIIFVENNIILIFKIKNILWADGVLLYHHYFFFFLSTILYGTCLDAYMHDSWPEKWFIHNEWMSESCYNRCITWI